MKYLISRECYNSKITKENKSVFLSSGQISEMVKKDLSTFLTALGYSIVSNISENSADLIIATIDEYKQINKYSPESYKLVIKENISKLDNSTKKKILFVDRKINYNKGLI